MRARGRQALEITGAPLISREEIVRAITQLRDAVAEAGRLLAEKLTFDYPTVLEQKVRQDWEAFIGQYGEAKCP